MIVGGIFSLIGKDKNGKELFFLQKHNTITKQGYDFLCDAIASTSRPERMAYIAIGKSAPEGETATRLGAEVQRKEAQYQHHAGTKFFTLSATFINAESITECGIFNAEEGGILFAFSTFLAVSAPLLFVQYTLSFEP